MAQQLPVGQGLLIIEVYVHTQTRHTGTIPLDEWSARHRDLYLTTDNTDIHASPPDSKPQSQQTSGRWLMP